MRYILNWKKPTYLSILIIFVLLDWKSAGMVILEDIFRESLPSINPKTLVLDHLARKSFAKEKVFLIGFGKAAAGMASGVIEYFGDYVAQGIVSVPFGTRKSMGKLLLYRFVCQWILEENAGAFSDRSSMWPVHENVKVLEVAENNLPDAAAVGIGSKTIEYAFFDWWFVEKTLRWRTIDEKTHPSRFLSSWRISNPMTSW